MDTQKKIYTVSELTHSLKHLIESKFAIVEVKGEVTNLRHQSSGHLYFSLKDQGAILSAVLFKGNASSLSKLPKEGDAIIAKGELSVYPPRGGYQLIVRDFVFAGIGELLLKLQKLKETLMAQGWFDKEKKPPLPKYPKIIGVVTSPTGSVIQDILHILTRRFSGFHLILHPAKVQGEGAAEEIAAAINAFNRYKLADVLIVGRGGGSLEDLWAFNELIVAEAVYNSSIPIVSAVGHETDFTICDFVASIRAPTPSAAAEIVLGEKYAQLQFLQSTQKQIERTITQSLAEKRAKLLGLKKHPLFISPYFLLGSHLQRIDDLQEEADRIIKSFIIQKTQKMNAFQQILSTLKPAFQLKTHQQKIHSLKNAISLAMKNRLEAQKNALKNLMSHMQSINPKHLLERGYCISFAENFDSIIIRAQDLSPGQKVGLLFHDGKVAAEVISHD